MPTQIIDNFDLTSQLPLDARLVVGPNAFFQTRDAIKNKYYGLRVWDFNENLPYVWTGSSWENENSGSVLVTNGQGGFLSKFTGSGSSNTITKSLIYEFVSGSNTFIGINKTLPAYQLDVNGNISSSSGFIGPGALITGINATNITGGALSLAIISTIGAVSNSLLFYNGTSTIWRPQTQIRVASATGIEITDENIDASLYNVIFYKNTNTLSDGQTIPSYRVSSSSGKLQFKPSTGQLFLSKGSETGPGLAFQADVPVGMYVESNYWEGLNFVLKFNNDTTENKGKRLRIKPQASGSLYSTDFVFYSNSFNSKSLTLNVNDNSNVLFTLSGSGTKEIRFSGQSQFYVDSPSSVNSLSISPGALTNQALTVNGVTTMNGVTNVAANFNVGASGNLRTATINGSLFVGGTTADQFQVSGMKALFTGSQISMGLSHDTTAFHGGILPKLVVKSSFDGPNDGKVALFTNGLWTNGKSAIIYLGDGNHYLSSSWGGPFLIRSIDPIDVHSEASGGSINLKVNGNNKIIINNTNTTLYGGVAMMKTTPDLVKNSGDSGTYINGSTYVISAVTHDRVIYIYRDYGNSSALDNSSKVITMEFYINDGSGDIKIGNIGQWGTSDPGTQNTVKFLNFNFIIPADCGFKIVTGNSNASTQGFNYRIFRFGR
jgi:hypothetical protein